MEQTQPDAALSEGDFAKLCKIIHQHTGITIGESRKSMLHSRLRPRLRETDEPDFKAYISRLSEDQSEVQQMINRVTTNETYFYRTPRVWEYFRQEYLPGILSKRSSGTVKVWSGASSTGEEGHTLGIVLEDQRQAHPGFDYRVVGTDISSRVLETAQNGVYNGRSIARFRKLEPDLFAQHMHGNDQDGYKVTAEIKSRITFKRHNLIDAQSKDGPFHAVFLRNVLIYFKQEDQEKILAHVHNAVHPDGILIIGESETLKGMRTQFHQIAPMIYRPGAV
ncbi:Chemotaxis protein methyltransferase CheR [Candidatus Rhodobacter oscarellae]|uniref:Chemotaxis protein methyltransferase n=1 Tax=Candidatus Rhodobacter oscarellae TaxID=1675527 RepID=A0A0J9E0N9_9RHOB|nr:protein-glutamate O-methyltransferase CheR [Candidatus Rhodobacter lobularis]KMW56217.1 Chemotaxis protein methyltransferase CheR [Candidatus Rhodobacter lobularis]